VNDVPTVAETLARLALDLTPETIRAPAMESAKACVMDYLGALLAGFDLEPARVVRDWVLHNGGKTEATVLGSGAKVPAAQAALTNGTTGHMVELDDVHTAAIGHPGVAVIPAALACSETRGLDGRRFLSCVVAGYEVMARMGIYMGIGHYAVWHPTATLGTLGACAAACQALGLSFDQATNAMAIAATMASGLREVFIGGSHCKHLHPGMAARNGVAAAELAWVSFTGPATAIEGPMGFKVAHSGSGDRSALAGLPNGRLHIQDTEFKVFASCRSAHTAAEAGILMHRAGLAPADVHSIVLEVPSVIAGDPAWGNLMPRNALAAKLSVPYNFAIALLDGACYLDQFAADRVSSTQVRELLSRTTLAASSDKDLAYPLHTGVRATARTRDGREWTQDLTVAVGHPLRPVPPEELQRKFLGLAEPAIREKARQVMELVLALDAAPDITGMMQMLEVQHGTR
jgi:2-methylcitrate dehydratase PrpD